MVQLLMKDEGYAIVGAAMEVYNELGTGFLEQVYQEAFEIELTLRNIPFESQRELPIYYKGRRLKKNYFADFVDYEKIVVEIKALQHLTSNDEGQLLHYLKATGFEVGLLFNFGSTNNLEWKRMVETRKKPKHAKRI